MAAGIAHEIRNPLGIIRATAERLERRYAAGAGDPHFRSIPEEVDRLSAILAGYLAFAADRPSELQSLDLVPLVQQAAATDAAALAEHRVRLETQVEVAAAPVRGDPARLRQVLLNLVLNAEQAMPAGGTVTVRLQADPRGGGFELRVADTGMGIPRTQLLNVWKPFFTSKPNGSGLGLAIARRIVEEHGGTIGIDSAEGRGTVITIRLPAEGHSSTGEDRK
jgi:signal transduction histidine kinase